MTAATTHTTAPIGQDVDAAAIDTLRFLAADMVEAAQSGHPGLPMGAAPLAWTLFSRHLDHDPAEPAWADRDRFVLSAGHGSALQYALLHLLGYRVTLDDLRAFRRLGSATPGHPEYGDTPGVETTTGPLGQGLANAVGLAVAERMLAARFPEVTDHRTYTIVGDGCLMEGISHEAASLAGHLRLDRLTVLFDDNDITIDGPARQACRDDHLARFAAYGWHVARVEDGTDVQAIDDALCAARADERPSLLAVRTVIGHGAPGVEGTSAAHGAPLGPETLAAAKQAAGWPAESFHVPESVRERCAALAAHGAQRHRAWRERFAAWAKTEPDRAGQWRQAMDRGVPADLTAALRQVPTGRDRATRQASRDCLAAAREVWPELIGGSADLAGSTGTAVAGGPVAEDDFGGSILRFGVREHAMAAVLNGISLHGGLRVWGSTFLVFSDYLRPALRLSALMRQPIVYVFTHDSVAVGEDGPTHQPVEHIESLRLIPGLQVLRPADDVETRAAWELALRTVDRPTALVLTRQSVPALPTLAGIEPDFLSRDGARIVRDVAQPELDLYASGSEVAPALEAAVILADRGLRPRVVSVPWRERFAARRAAFEPAGYAVAIEAGTPGGWAALADLVIGVERFGASGPGAAILAELGLTGPAIAARIAEDLKQRRAAERGD